MAWWLSAWLRGDESPDEFLAAVIGDDAAHDVVGLPGEDEPVPLPLALGSLRLFNVRKAGLALPVEGDPAGLGGPPDFNAEALEVGEAVVLAETGYGLVPHRACA